MKIRITIGSLTTEGELFDTETARAVAGILPYRSPFNTWGDEIYFATPVQAQLEEEAGDRVEAGDLGFWPPAQAFCIFFGPTPMSGPGEIVAASPVNIIGKIHGDPSRFKTVMAEKEIILEPAD